MPCKSHRDGCQNMDERRRSAASGGNVRNSPNMTHEPGGRGSSPLHDTAVGRGRDWDSLVVWSFPPLPFFLLVLLFYDSFNPNILRLFTVMKQTEKVSSVNAAQGGACVRSSLNTSTCVRPVVWAPNHCRLLASTRSNTQSRGRACPPEERIANVLAG